MKAPITPKSELQRISVLRSLNILDTRAEERFDKITHLASELLGMPIALISLVDENRQWFKSKVGLDADETQRDVSFCGHAILEDEVFIIEDSRLDERFSDNPLVTGAPEVVFYAGAQLKVNEQSIGTLCVIDSKPRKLSEHERKLLRDLSAWATAELQLSQFKQVTDELSNEKNYLSNILRSMQESVALISSQTSKVESCNEAFAKLFDKTTDDLIGNDADEVFNAVEFKRFNWQEPQSNAELHINLSENKKITVRADSQMIKHQGQSKVLVTMRDVSEQTYAQRIKSQFVSMVSHELRTPLTAISGSLVLLQHSNGYSDALDDDERMLVDIAQRNIDRLTYMVNDILDMEKVMSGTLDINLAQHDLVRLTNEVAEVFSPLALSKGIRLTYTSNIDSYIFSTDHHRVTQILTNLLGNALKFSPVNSVVDLCLQVDDDLARVSVKDQGPGIDPKEHDLVFKQFYQADSSKVKHHEGTGLGLAISKELAARLGGELTIESALGEGAVFTLTFSRQQK